MRTLRAVAAGGRIVLASLHQPSRDMFLSLDRAVLMAHGRVLYAGPPAEADAWFAAAGLPCPADTAVAEHMLKVRHSGGAFWGGPVLDCWTAARAQTSRALCPAPDNGITLRISGLAD